MYNLFMTAAFSDIPWTRTDNLVVTRDSYKYSYFSVSFCSLLFVVFIVAVKGNVKVVKTVHQ